MILDAKVGSVARRDLLTVDENESIQSAAEVMTNRGVGSVFVTRGGEPVGIVTERDLLSKVIAAGRDPRKTKVKEVMSSPPISIEAEKTLREAVDLMARRRIRRLAVTETGRITGLITQRDILSLNRTCLYCGKEVKPVLEGMGEAEPYVECECGARYHLECAKTVVYCSDCSRSIVTHIFYPEPSETMSG